MLQFVQAALSNNIFAGLSFAKKEKGNKRRKARRQRFLDNHAN